MVLTAVTVAVSYANLGNWSLYVALIVAFVKAALVALWTVKPVSLVALSTQLRATVGGFIPATLAVSPDGRRVATSGGGDTARQ